MKESPVIPLGAGVVSDWQSISLLESDEPIVAIGRGTDYDDILTSAVYAGEHLHSPYREDNVIDAAVPVIFVRESVATRLRQAQAQLPGDLRLIVFDGYRSVEVQRALFDQFLDELRTLKPSWTEEELSQETERYVALPSTDASCPSPHSTGGAVDVAIVQGGRMIEFGTPFDHGSRRSALRYFEEDDHAKSESDIVARNNRRLLYHVMTGAGFDGFEHEWWHYNAVETQMGACAAQRKQAVYGNATDLLLKSTFPRVRQVLSDHQEPSAPIDRIAPTN